MNAVANPLLIEAAELSESVVRPIPGSHKIHVGGSHADIRVPMREVALDVSLSTSNPSIATVPASVRLQRGSAQFTIATRGEGCATITATLGSQIVRRTIHVVYTGG